MSRWGRVIGIRYDSPGGGTRKILDGFLERNSWNGDGGGLRWVMNRSERGEDGPN